MAVVTVVAMAVTVVMVVAMVTMVLVATVVVWRRETAMAATVAGVNHRDADGEDERARRERWRSGAGGWCARVMCRTANRGARAWRTRAARPGRALRDLLLIHSGLFGKDARRAKGP